MKLLARQLSIAILLAAAFISANLPSATNTVVLTAQAQNSTLTFTVPTAKVADLVAAFDANYARSNANASFPELPVNATNNANFVRRVTRQYFWVPMVNQNKNDVAAASVVKVTEPDFGN